MSDTPAATGSDTAAETELRRWLGELVADTLTDPQAWETIHSRITAAPPTAPRPAGIRGRPRLAVAVAAAVVLVIAAAIAVSRHPGSGEVETVDDITTTTDPDEPTTIDAEGSTTSTTDSTTSISLPPGSPGSGNDVGDPSGTGDAAVPGTDPSGAAASAGGGSPPGTGPTTTTAAPSRQTPALTVATSDYTVEVVLDNATYEGQVNEYLRRADLTEPGYDGPDGYSYQVGLIWPLNDAPPSAGRCISTNIVAEHHQLTPHRFVAGLVGPGITTVDVVMTDGSRVRPRIGTRHPGHHVRPWLAEVAQTDVDRVEGFDAGGDLVLTAPWFPGATLESPVRC